MMTRDEIRELAAFQADETKGACALSFYFQPDPPQDRSHRREAIVAKDIVKQALKSTVASGKNGSLHADLDRVLNLATNLRGNARGKAVFACSARNLRRTRTTKNCISCWPSPWPAPAAGPRPAASSDAWNRY